MAELARESNKFVDLARAAKEEEARRRREEEEAAAAVIEGLVEGEGEG